MVASWTLEHESNLQAPFTYLDKKPGKDMRLKHIEAFNAVLQIPLTKARGVGFIIQTLHTASLLVDDVEDNASLRRGMPVAHSIFGVPQTINTASYNMFVTLQTCIDLFGVQSATIFSQELCSLHQGQGLDLYWRDTYQCPTEDEYILMVTKKTSGLYRLAIRLMQSRSDAKVDLVPLANTLGILYQIQDDYLNLQSNEYSSNKGYCEDITEGKFSFPILHSIRSDPQNQELMNILRQRTQDRVLKEYAVKLMEKSGSFEYTRQAIQKYVQEASVQIADLPIAHELRLPLLDLLRHLVLIDKLG